MTQTAQTPDPCAVLALDSSTEVLHLGLAQGAQGAHPRTLRLPGGSLASATLLPQLLALLAEAGLAMHHVGHLVFGVGPGAFTGVRTACSAVQGLALGIAAQREALGLLPPRLTPVDTLTAVAAEAALQLGALGIAPPPEFVVAQDARMGEWYVGSFTCVQQSDSSHMSSCVCSLQGEIALQAAHAWGSSAPVFGSARSSHAVFFAPLPQDYPAEFSPEPSARALLHLAQTAEVTAPSHALSPTDFASYLGLHTTPRYVRNKVAQTTAERAKT